MSKRLQKMLYGLLLAMTSAAIVAEMDPSTARDSPMVIGVPLPMTGEYQAFGSMMKNSFELALETLNAGGGINGRLLQLSYGDDQSNPELAEQVVADLIERAGAVMLTGGYQSDTTYALARAANARDIPFLVSTAAADKITQKGWHNIYRLNPPVSEYTTGLENFLIKELQPKTMAIVYEDSMFGTSAAAAMMTFLRQTGIEMSHLISYSSAQATPFYLRSLLAPLTAEAPDIIYMISYLSDGIALVRALRNLQIPSQLVGGAGGFTHPRFLEEAADDAEGMLVVTLWSEQLPYAGAKSFFNRYLEAYGVAPDYHGAEAYSALLVAADALKRVDSPEPAAVREALDKTRLMTPFGPVKFYTYEDFERQNSVRTQVLQVRDGEFQLVWPLGLARISFAPR
ncbi:MAG: ABC transporter substrate-binding protein [Gammaproteobacteria bacterium]|jgi:branched-chain amino acid transport system substrate-binding protein